MRAFLSHLPYDVTPEQALQHEAVRDRVKHSMQCLQDTTDYFLLAILQSVDKIPYVLLLCFGLTVAVFCTLSFSFICLETKIGLSYTLVSAGC